MCGIVGVIGSRDAGSDLVEMLKKLEYRGYDSAGVAVSGADGIQVVKKKGRVEILERELKERPLKGRSGIGHTRWATHGVPSDLNAHPMLSSSSSVAIVHNGIIENYRPLKEELLEKGYRFTSETDSEVIAHLTEEYVRAHEDFQVRELIRFLASRLRGAFAILVHFSDRPREIIGLRYGGPLNYVEGDGVKAISSDISSLVAYGREIEVLKEGQAVHLAPDFARVYDFEGEEASPVRVSVTWDVGEAEKSGYRHFLRKEIGEQPQAVRALATSLGGSCDEVHRFMKEMDPTSVVFIACGSASYSCAFGAILSRQWRLSQRVLWEIGSEFRYKPYPVDDRTMVIAVSQSGETADTIAAVRQAKENGARVVSFVNVAGSTLDMISDISVHLAAGPEIAVPSTKAVVNQFLATSFIVESLKNGSRSGFESWARGLERLAQGIDDIIGEEETWTKVSRILSGHQSMFVLGRGLDYPVALEAALKLKETAYIHAEAMYAGEFKHGPISLVEYGMPVICLLGDESVRDKTVSNIEEVIARGAQAFIVDPFGFRHESLDYLGEYFSLPETPPPYNVLLQLVVVQLLAYHAGVTRNIDVDKPRNLAKSVTVE